MSDELETAFVCHRCKAEWWITGYDRSVTVSSRGKVSEHLSAPPTWVEVCRGMGLFAVAYFCGSCADALRFPEAFLTDREAT